MQNGSAVVLIGVCRRGVGCDNGTRLAKDDSANFAFIGFSEVRPMRAIRPKSA
jgi:hypothetical protein